MATKPNELNKLLYEYNLANGTNIVNFDNLEDVVNNGWSTNPDVYSITDKIANMYVGVPKKPYRKKDDGTFEEITDPEIVKLVNKPNKNETLMQFNKLRYLFYLTTGNSFVYAPKLANGNDKGQLLPDIGMCIMPSQYTEIISGGWLEPVRGYIINYNYTAKDLPASQVIHIKMPNLRFLNGDNLYGLSPIRVASLIIQAQNSGYGSIAKTLKQGFPLGIYSKEGESDDDETMATNRANVFAKIWDKLSKKKRPIITAGKGTWQKIGFDNFKDLQIIENSQHGLRVLCNVYSVPSQLFNDVSGTTFNNMKEARKAAYTNRIIPDCNLFDEVDNINIWSNYGFEVYSDFSAIPELQEDKKSMAEVINVLQQAGALLTAEEI